MKNNIIAAFILFFISISLFLHLFQINKIPPCLNADEAGYNSYSILKTGKDEYGAFLPLRLKSFLDFKLPLYSYFSIPFMAVMGLNEYSTRALNILLGVAFVPLVYFVIKEMFGDEKIALIGSFLTSISLWIHILSRQAHEGVICAFFILLAVLFLIKYLKKQHLSYLLLTNTAILLSTFSYHSARIFLIFFFFYEICLLFVNRKNKSRTYLLTALSLLIIIIAIPLIADYRYSINRVTNLWFYKNSGFYLGLSEYLTEHRLRIFHNELTEGIRSITTRYFEQISPEFFLIWGDKTWRFGYKNLGLITSVEYIFLLVGLYYLFKNKSPYRLLLVSLFLISPLPNALTWQEYSLIRTYFMIFPIIIIVSYGVFNFIISIINYRLKIIYISVIFFGFAFYLLNNWDIYLFHYPKRIEVIRAWQCGYKQLVDYININYNKFDKFYITRKNGQPYIFLLFYLKYPPEKYQKVAQLTSADQYGFGQVKNFDKFNFDFNLPKLNEKAMAIGYPDDFGSFDNNKIKKVQINSEEIFWIFENSK